VSQNHDLSKGNAELAEQLMTLQEELKASKELLIVMNNEKNCKEFNTVPLSLTLSDVTVVSKT